MLASSKVSYGFRRSQVVFSPARGFQHVQISGEPQPDIEEMKGGEEEQIKRKAHFNQQSHAQRKGDKERDWLSLGNRSQQYFIFISMQKKCSKE